jgi:Domain of unknown function (DUF4112)
MAGSFKITPGGTEESVARLEALGGLMDGMFVLPGTNIRLGLDAIIGLVPVAGAGAAGPGGCRKRPGRRGQRALWRDNLDENGAAIRVRSGGRSVSRSRRTRTDASPL